MSAGVRPELRFEGEHPIAFERVQVRADGIGELPLVGFASRFTDFRWGAPRPGTKLGAYPVAAVEITAVD